MQKLALLCLVCSFIYSCKSTEISGNIVTSEVIENVYFSNSAIDYIYNAEITAFSKEFSGIIIVKRINSDAHRVVMTSDFGNTLMDFTISESEFKINYILEDFNKRLLLNVLKEDFRMLTQTNIQTFSKDDSVDYNVYYSKLDNKNSKYVYSNSENRLSKIYLLKNNKEIVIFEFSDIEENISSKIEINHKNIPLQIKLTKQ